MNESKKALQDAIQLDRQGKHKNAKTLYRRAIRLNPRNIKAFDRYSLFLYTRRQFKEGIKVMKIGLELNPNRRELSSFMGMHLYQMGAIDKAFTAFRDGGAVTDRYDIHAIFAQCAMLVEDYAVAAAEIRQYLKHRPSKLASKDFAFKTQLSIALMRMGSIQIAQQILNEVRAHHPRYLQARKARAELYFRRGECNKAAEAYQRLLSRSKTNELALRIGSAYLCLKRYKDALTVANLYLDEHSTQLAKLLASPSGKYRHSLQARRLIEGLLLRGDAVMRTQQYEQALADYKKAEHLSGGLANAVFRVAHVHYQMGAYPEVVKRLRVELKKPATTPKIVVLSLRAAIRTNNIPLALRCTQRLLEKQKPSPAHYYFAGMAYNSAGKFSTSIKVLKVAVEKLPKSRQARHELVRAYCYQAQRELRKNRPQKASHLLLLASSVNPRSVTVHQNLAVVYLKQGKGKEAEKHAKNILDVNPNDIFGNRLLGRALHMQGKYREAMGSYRKALKATKNKKELTAKILIEASIARIKAGMADQGIVNLKQARNALRREKHSKLQKAIARNLIRAKFHLGSEALHAGNPKKAWRALKTANNQRSRLSSTEKGVVQAVATLAAIFGGKKKIALRMIKRYRARFRKSLIAPYNRFGYELMRAYLDLRSGDAVRVSNAASKLEKLAAQVDASTKKKLRSQASAAYSKLGNRFYQVGKLRQASMVYVKAIQLANVVFPTLRHNKAVIDYYTGKKQAINALFASTRKVPLAFCNLAVHQEHKGNMVKSYELFSICAKGRVRIFPFLKEILEIKREIFGKKKEARSSEHDS